MNPATQAVLHGVGGLVAVVAAVVLCVTGHVSGAEALAIILAASGISGTGIASATTSAPPASSSTAPSVVKPAAPASAPPPAS